VATVGELVDAGLIAILRGSATPKDDNFKWWSPATRVVTSKVLFSGHTYNEFGARYSSGPESSDGDQLILGPRDVVLGRANTGYLAVPWATNGTWALGKGMQALRVSDALDPRYVAESICSRWNDRHEALFDPTARSDIRRYEIALLPLDEQRTSMDRLYELRQSHNRLRSIVSMLESADIDLRDALTAGDGVVAESAPILRLNRAKGLRT
jgi:hypothetical protein